ncbi:MAG TPA: VOC family protein [Acetobacteraceae bacterium]|nr:VOC family protein [Acetobacteraceae bacterium]
MSLPALDHLVLDVGEDLDAAASTYRDLGFHLTDRGHHTLGSSNHLAMFATNYLELLSPGPPGGTIRPELAGFPPGLNGLVFATDDADARHRDLQARGVDVREPQSFSRPVTLADGTTRDARFRTTHLSRSEVPFGRLYFCRHFTRDLVWRPEWQRHPNGAREIAGIMISADEPAAVASLFTRMFGVEPARSGAGLSFSAGATALEILPREEAARQLGDAMPDSANRPAFIALIRLKTASLRQARESIATTASAAPRDECLVVPARAAGNVALAFAE